MERRRSDRRATVLTAPSRTLAGIRPSRATVARAALVTASALILHVAVLGSRIGIVDADESVVGLMARHVLHGDLRTFFWGQAQGGSIEAYLIALSFKIFGTNGFALKVVPLAMFGVASFLVWRIGLRTVGRRASSIAVAIFWVGSAGFVWWSTKARGHYSPSLPIELMVVLLTLRIVSRDDTERRALVTDAALLGLFLGLGWWETPEIVYVGIPAIAWIIWHIRSRIAHLWPAIPAAVVGALPWIVFNVRHSWASLHQASWSRVHHIPTTLYRFFRVLLPQALGFRLPETHEWIPAFVGVILYVSCLALFARRLLDRDRRLLILIAVLYPFLYMLFPLSYRTDVRYVFFLWPFIALLAAWGVDAISARQQWPAVLAVILIASLSLGGIVAMIEHRPAWNRWDISLPTQLGPFTRSLEERGIRYAYASYAIAYPITFQSHEQIIVTPIEHGRSKVYAEAVGRDPLPAFILFDDPAILAGFESTLRRRSIEPDCRRIAGFVLCVPESRVPLDLVRPYLQ